MSNRKAELELEIKNLKEQNDKKQQYCDRIDREDASEDISHYLSGIEIEQFEDFDVLWRDYCSFYENEEYYCKEIHKEILNKRFSRKDDVEK